MTSTSRVINLSDYRAEPPAHATPPNLKYSTEAKDVQMNAIALLAGENAIINLYNGTQPASPDTAITSQTLLASLTCAATFGAVEDGVLTLNAITSGTGTAAAGAGVIPTWYRITTSEGKAVIDGSAGPCNDLNISGSIATGQTVAVSAFELSHGN